MGCTDQDVYGVSRVYRKTKKKNNELTPKEWNRINNESLDLSKNVNLAMARKKMNQNEPSRQDRAWIKRTVLEMIKEDLIAIANRKNAFHLGAIGSGGKYFDIIISTGKMPKEYMNYNLRLRDCAIDAKNIDRVILSKLSILTQSELLFLLKERLGVNKKLKLKPALKSKKSAKRK